ncbi:hypothetical protein ACFFTM_20045 [Pseudoduganella plicata]|uniref:DUF4402 domain-containing protein n=1 Tax=Pseudoduganella plicata TaxID=321984 RepID=A0A4P7BEK8_9BURK|nr:hypothetical protein [Pseudoduganella plicata]QBQ37161.1 hypothetical protein E1742_13995 [Pseudoduganella plicata]GGY98846.1 hypothetical protein GCM10007388_35580 [Pseudoduganella plicata]
MKYVTPAAALVGLISAAALPGSALAVTFELGRGHFVIRMDDTVETFQVTALEVPGSCTPTLTAVQKAGGTIEIQSSAPQCQGDPYGELRLNPTWSSALTVNMAAGQIDFAGSTMAQLASIHARVRAGDIFGLPGVKRNWLFGAQLDAQLKPEGVALRTELGAGQISLAPAAAQ